MSAKGFVHRPVAPGARIALIAPASPFDTAAFERGVARLSHRYCVEYSPDITARKGFLAGDDAHRLRALRALLDRKDVDVIMAARGGHGCTRIAPLVAADEIRRGAPLLVGFSDLTALHAVWAHAGIGSLHGSMVAALSSMSSTMFQRFYDALEGRFPERYADLNTLAGGVAQGVLLGGNLTVLSALIGTPLFPPLTDAVLFLEDVGERPYRVDRMLTTWRNAGAFQGVRGILVGAFVQGEPGPDAVTLAEVLQERLCDLGIPVLAGFPAGHIENNCELPFGRRVVLDANNAVVYLQPGSPC